MSIKHSPLIDITVEKAFIRCVSREKGKDRPDSSRCNALTLLLPPALVDLCGERKNVNQTLRQEWKEDKTHSQDERFV